MLAQRKGEELRKATERPQTVADLLDEYVERHCKPGQRKWNMTASVYEMRVKATLGTIPLGELCSRDVGRLLDELQNGKGFRAQVNRVRSQIVAALN